MDEKYTCKKKQVETYQFKFEGGDWAKFSIDPDDWGFAVQFPGGSYAYNGWSPETGRTFKEFLCTLNDKYYLLNKLTDTVLDFDASINLWRKYIFEDRREGRMTKEQARNAYDDLMDFEGNDCAPANAFYYKICNSPALSRMLDTHWEDPYVKNFSLQANWFYDKLFTALVEVLKEETK